MLFRNYYLKEALEIHNSLNKKLFNEDNKLKDDVYEALQDIVQEFIKNLKDNDVPIHVLDTWFVGSNAAYNYTPKSDIDLHLQVNLEQGSDDPKILKLLYDYARSSFNKNYNIRVKGFPVELYIEDMNSNSISNGVYSLNKNDWIKFPDKTSLTNEVATVDISDRKKFKELIQEYNNISDSESIQKLIDDLYLLRKTSISTQGEFGEGNLIFKEFRNRGLLDVLKNKLYDVRSQELTLEKFNR